MTGGEASVGTRVVAVVVTYRSDDVLPELLSSLDEHEPDVPVIVVDDGSPDGPPEVGGHRLIANEENLGFAVAANRGVTAAADLDPEHIAFLNPDVRLLGPSLTQLADLLAEREQVAVATGPVQSPEGRRLPSAWGPTSHRRALAFAAGSAPVRMRGAAGEILNTAKVSTAEASRIVDDLRVEGHVVGGTMIVRSEVLREVGGFDEEFFVYWEDADLCHRIRHAGWEIRVLPCTPFVHANRSRSSAGVTDEDRWRWFVSGAHRFGKKHLVPGQARQLEAALTLGRRLYKLRQRG